MRLTPIIVLASVLTWARAAEATVTAQVVVGNQVIRVDSAGPGELRISGIGTMPVPFHLPGNAGVVTELRATEWHPSPGSPGVALAIEAVAANDVAKRSYYWATLPLSSRPGEAVRSPTVGEILLDSTDLDLAGLVNSGYGDSIYVVLARRAGDAITGYVFVHGCPILPTPGRLLTLSAQGPGDRR